MLHPHWDDTGGGVVANGLAFRAHAELIELEDLLELDVPVLDPGDLGHADDAPDAAAKARLLNDQMDGRADGLADGPRGKVLSCLENQGLEPDQGLVRVVRMKGRH